MFKLISFLILFSLVLFQVGSTLAQSYTYNPANPGCDGTWENGACWDKAPINDPLGCTDNGAWPPYSPSGCKVEVIINDDLTLGSGVIFGGRFSSLTIGNGATLQVNGDLTIEQNKTIAFNTLAEGELIITGMLVLSQASSAPKTTFRAGGDGTGMQTAGSVDLRGNATLEILKLGSFTALGETLYNGSSSSVEVYGYFRTQAIDVQGGNKHQLNTHGNASVIIDENMLIGGSSEFSFSGDSQIDIGGSLIINGSATTTASSNAKVYICGDIDAREGSFPTTENGEFIPNSCRILPITLLSQQVHYNRLAHQVEISWLTHQEDGNYTFWVEKAVNEIEGFHAIKKLANTGSGNTTETYQIVDNDLPFHDSRLYYRILKEDSNGIQSFVGDLMSVEIRGLEKDKVIWRAFPNPSDGNGFRIKLLDGSLYQGEPLEVSVFGIAGPIHNSIVRSEEAINETLRPVFERVANGVYVIQMKWGSHSEKMKIIKGR